MTGVKPLIVSLLCLAAAAPAVPRGPAPNSVQIEYGETAKPDHAPLRQILVEHRILENFRDFLGMLVLPRPLTLKLEDCDGYADAWYEPTSESITVCYDYIEELRANVPKETTEDGVTPEDAVIGPVFEVFLHEISHALFKMLKMPILGREEDAADQFAAMFLLQMGKENSKRIIAATALMYWREAQEGDPDKADFASAHSPPIQRFYNLVCIAYGSDKELFGYVRDKYLGAARADECVDEAETLKFAFSKLMGPHIDEKARRQFELVDWMPAARRILEIRTNTANLNAGNE